MKSKPNSKKSKKSSKKEINKRFDLNVGGQAVIEGVVMRCKNRVGIAVRKPNNKISLKKQRINSLTSKPFFKLPLVRGVIILIETLIFGIKALNYSANESIDETEEKISKLELFITTVVAFIFAILLFILLLIPGGKSF